MAGLIHLTKVPIAKPCQRPATLNPICFGEFMPKIPDDMSAAAIAKRAANSAIAVEKAKAKLAEPVAPPKPRIAKKR